MRKSKFEEEWDKIEAEKSRQEQRSLDLLCQVKTLRDGNNRLSNMVNELSQRLKETETALKGAEDEAWMANAKLSLYEQADVMPSFQDAPLSCPYCGGEKIDTQYQKRSRPYRTEYSNHAGHPARISHRCSACGAFLCYTKTLEASL